MRLWTALRFVSACALFGACAERAAATTAAHPDVHEGDLNACQARGHVDLSHLPPLVAVTGSLNLRQCLELERMDGLEQLERVGSLGLLQVPRLRRVDGAAKLKTVDESLVVSNMKSLESLEGFGALTSVGENLVLEALPALERVDGLGAVTRVGHLQVMRNPLLEDLSGLAALRVVQGELRITDNPQLPKSAIEAFLARVEVKGEVRVEQNGP